MFELYDPRRTILITGCILASLIIVVSLYCTIKKCAYSSDRPTDPSRIVVVRPETTPPVYVPPPLLSRETAVQPVTYPQSTVITVDQASPTLTYQPHQCYVPMLPPSPSPAQYPYPSRSSMPTTYPSSTQVPPTSYPPMISSQVATTTNSAPPAYTPSTI